MYKNVFCEIRFILIAYTAAKKIIAPLTQKFLNSHPTYILKFLDSQIILYMTIQNINKKYKQNINWTYGKPMFICIQLQVVSMGSM